MGTNGRPQKIIFADLREASVKQVLIYCSDSPLQPLQRRG
jgi:hypothetical protein